MKLGVVTFSTVSLTLMGGLEFAVFLHGHQFIDAAENRVALGGDRLFDNGEGVDDCALQNQVPDQVLVQGVGSHDLAVGVSGGIQPLLVR